MLGRLDRCGSQSVSDLAAAERVRPQSMAQTVGDLEAEGLVERKPDPDDRRRALVILTAAGKSRIEADRRAREGWLVDAFEEMPEADLRGDRALGRDPSPGRRRRRLAAAGAEAAVATGGIGELGHLDRHRRSPPASRTSWAIRAPASIRTVSAGSLFSSSTRTSPR